MKRIWLIFWETYTSHITRPSFLLFTFGLPIIFALTPMILVSLTLMVVTAALPPTRPMPVGLVNESGLAFLDDETTYLTEPMGLRRFDTVEAAALALQAEEIQAYYHFPADYWETGRVNGRYNPAAPPSPDITSAFDRWLNSQVYGQVPLEFFRRYQQGSEIVAQTAGGQDAFQETAYLQWGVTFALIYFVRLMAMFTSGFMYGSITNESHNRTIEIILTSVTPWQFVMGKICGLLLVGFTQLAVWGGLPFVLVWLTAQVLNDNSLWQELNSWTHMGYIFVLLAGAYILDQLLAAGTGILRITGGAGPQIFNTLGWIMSFALIYSAYFVPLAPNSWLAVALSFFPFTVSVVMPVRVLAGTVPEWQLWVSQLVLWLSCLGGVWVLGRLVQLNLVSYADRFDLWQWVKRSKKSKKVLSAE